jgi:LmeA-like phospholipid-binding
MRKLVAALLVVGILLVITDRVAVVIAQRDISSRVASAYDLPGRPAVRIHGFPFLTQVAMGGYAVVDVRMGRVIAGGVPVSRLDARFTGVRAPLSQLLGQGASTVTADHATATALVPLAAVRQRLPRGLPLHLTVTSVSVSAGGVRITASGQDVRFANRP